jgi:excisionase family DNA binding protein
MTTSDHPPIVLPDPLLRPTLPIWPDTCQLLGLSRSATYDAVKRGDIPSIRIGGRILVATAELRRMVSVDRFSAVELDDVGAQS